jgi:hypothetical protein
MKHDNIPIPTFVHNLKEIALKMNSIDYDANQ